MCCANITRKKSISRLEKKSFGIEDIICSLKWARRLKEEGVKQSSLYYWRLSPFSMLWQIISNSDLLLHEAEDVIAAFTVPEFDIMFPKCYRLAKDGHQWKLGFNDAKDNLVSIHLPDEANMANVYATMLLSIIKNKQKRIGDADS